MQDLKALVAATGLWLTERTPGADRRVIVCFGLFHDAVRVDDDADPDHGERAGALVVRLADSLLGLTLTRVDLLRDACARHTSAVRDDGPTVGCCFDADRLHLVRFGRELDPTRLSTTAARHPGAVETARKHWLAPPPWKELSTTFGRPYGARRPAVADGVGAELGPVFDNADQALSLYRFVGECRPDVVVELGTGLELSALAMAAAVAGTGSGVVYTVDDHQLLRDQPRYLDLAADACQTAGLERPRTASPTASFEDLVAFTDLTAHLVPLAGRLELADDRALDGYPFATRSVDLVFSDFSHAPADLLDVLAHFLPRLATPSTVVFDAVPTSPASRLLLDKVVRDLDAGLISPALQRHCVTDLAAFASGHRLSVGHLRSGDMAGPQGGASWVHVTRR